jgi:hypothetical protein
MICPRAPITAVWRRHVCKIVAVGAALFLLAGPASAVELCVQLVRDEQVYRSIPAGPGNELRLRFRHSIYGSEVEETFHIQSDGFQLAQLRYGEARLAEFYGHEDAKQDRGVWVVRPRPQLFRALDLRVSADGAMSLIVGAPSHRLNLFVQPGAAVRVMIATCKTRDG